MIIGIDPGKRMGLAIYDSGDLVSLDTLLPYDLLAYIEAERPALVVLEDSRIQGAVWTGRGQPRAAALKIARNVGEVDCHCDYIEAACQAAGADLISVSPLQKGAKLDRARFAELTGWALRCNQHERDAAMAAWQFRHKKLDRGRGKVVV